MGNHKAGAAAHQVVHGGLDALFGAGVHTAGGFVQNQNFVVCQNGAGNRQQLFLALAHVGSILVQLHLVAAGQRADKVVGTGGLGGGDDFLIGGIQTAIADVFHNGALEQPGILQYHAKAFAQGAAVKVLYVVAVQRNGAGVDIVKAHQQLDHGGFACAGGADNGNFLAGFYIAAEIPDNSLFRRVAKLDMVKGDLAVNAGGVCPAGGVSVLFFFWLTQKFKHALRSRRHTLQHVADLGQLLDGLGEVAHILDERLDVTNGDDAARGKNAAGNGHCYIAQVAHKGHDGLHQAGKKLAFPGGFKQAVVGFVKIIQNGIFAVERFDHIVAGIYFLHLAVHGAQNFLLGAEIFLAEPDHQQHQRHRDRQDQNGNQRHRGADGQHHDEHADHGGNAGDQLGNALVQALAQGVHIVGNAGKYLAHGALFKIGKRQAVDLFADLAAEVITHLLRKPAHDPALAETERSGNQIHDQQDQQDFADIAKVNAAGAPQLGHPAGGQGSGGFGQHLGACNIKNRGKNGKNNHGNQAELVVPQLCQQAAHGALKVFCLLGRHSSGMRHQASPPFRSSSLLLSWLRAISW